MDSYFLLRKESSKETLQTLSRNVLGIALVLSALLCKKVGKENLQIIGLCVF